MKSLAIEPLQAVFLSVFPRTGKPGYPSVVPAIMALVLIMLEYPELVL
jgi:hypothetical protein